MVKFNGNNIGSAFYGGTPISKIYKGTELVYEKSKQFITGTVVDPNSAALFILNGNIIDIRTEGKVNSDGSFFYEIKDQVTEITFFKYPDLMGSSNFKTLDLNKVDISAIPNSKLSSIFRDMNNLIDVNILEWDVTGKTVSYMFELNSDISKPRTITLPRNFNKAGAYLYPFRGNLDNTTSLCIRCTSAIKSWIKLKSSYFFTDSEYNSIIWEIIN